MLRPGAVRTNTCPIVPVQDASAGGVKVMLAIVHVAPSSDMTHAMLPLGSANVDSARAPGGGAVGVDPPVPPGLEPPDAADDDAGSAVPPSSPPPRTPVTASTATSASPSSSTASTTMKMSIPRLRRRGGGVGPTAVIRDLLVVGPSPGAHAAGRSSAWPTQPDMTTRTGPTRRESPGGPGAGRPFGSGRAQDVHGGRPAGDAADAAAAACAGAREHDPRLVCRDAPRAGVGVVLGPGPREVAVEDVAGGQREV